MHVLSIDKILQTKNLPSWIYKAAFELKVGGYLPAGEFFEKLDDVEILQMRDFAKSVSTENFVQFELDTSDSEIYLRHLALLCFILALGEGQIEVTPDLLTEMLPFLFLLIAIEHMYRQGEVEVIREHYSILDGQKPVVKEKKKK